MLIRFFNLHTYLGTVLVIAYRRNTKPLNPHTKLARKITFCLLHEVALYPQHRYT